MKKSTLVRAGGVAAAALGTTVALTLPAQAAVHPDTSTRGTCTMSSKIKLDVTQQGTNSNRKLSVKATINGGQNGGNLDYVITDNGTQLKTGTKRTMNHSKTTIQKTIPNATGPDIVIFASTNSVTAEVCTAQVTYNG